jgi:hypothetical protein
MGCYGLIDGFIIPLAGFIFSLLTGHQMRELLVCLDMISREMSDPLPPIRCRSKMSGVV